MPAMRSTLLRLAATALLGLGPMALIGPATAAGAAGGEAIERTSEREALHLLNRLGYGPAPGDLQHVMAIGADRYIDEQLHPERLALPASIERLNTSDAQAPSQKALIEQFRAAMKAAKESKARDGTANPNAGDSALSARRELVQEVAETAALGRIQRAIESPRQLQEVMVDFWFNHFNIFQGKGLDRVLIGSYEREALRPYALGRFRDLLGATAHHPAMLFYLDNWLSTAPGFGTPGAAGSRAKANGLNENYARELMELHTLGVDGGYTQQDVTELARILTGWTLRPNNHGSPGDSAFSFDARRHDTGRKTLLGQPVPAGGKSGGNSVGNSDGESEGEWALDLLARHPATARHISYKLAQYFVADTPPPALVDRLAQRFIATDGDIRAVLATLFASREFRASEAWGSKFKTPYHYVVSALRASGVKVANPRPVQFKLNQMGMPLFGCTTPDGYKNTEAAWLNADTLPRRLGFATALAAGRLPLGSDRPAGRNADDPPRGARLDPVDPAALERTLGNTLSPHTQAAIASEAPALRAAMLLGSPDFMRR